MDDEQVKVDAIVVGGGPAGAAAAYTLAKAGCEVILIERGEYAGSKNMGGLVYSTVLEQMIPDFAASAPLERSVASRTICYLGERDHMAMNFGSRDWAEPPCNHTHTVHRSQFDRWFAQQAEEAGASLLEGMLVEELVYAGEGDGKRVAGVKLRGEEEPFLADVVILCDGANNLVSRQAIEQLGLRPGRREQDYAVGVKETIALPRQTIEDRFGLDGDEGCALDFIGVPFRGLVGGGFIYTQKEDICIGAVARIETVTEGDRTPNEIMDEFKRHPVLARYLRGGELVEYSAHMLPEGGYHALGQLAGNGVMICGDAAGLLNVSLYKEGTNHAMESGKMAAETAIEAKEAGDFSYAALKAYEDKLQQSIAVQDLKKYADLGDILGSTPEVLGDYPARFTRMLVDYFTAGYEPKKDIQKRARKQAMTGMLNLGTLARMWRARKLM